MIRQNKIISFKLIPGRGQSILEYVLIILVVVAAISAMSVYVQRSVQANLKLMEDQINVEANNTTGG